LKAVHHIIVSSAETIDTFNKGFDTVNLHALKPQALAIRVLTLSTNTAPPASDGWM
jgi:hypothetical protein